MENGYKQRYSHLKRRNRDDAEKLFIENLKLVNYALRKIYGFGAEKDEDKYQNACLGLWNACVYYDEEKETSFSTYASRCIFNWISTENRKEAKRIHPSRYLSDAVSIDKNDWDGEPPTLADVIPSPDSEKAFELADFQEFLGGLTPDERKVANAMIRGEPVYKLQKRIGKTWWWGKQQKEGIKRKFEGIV